MYYKGADAALIVFDIGDAKTFKSVHYWIGEMDKNCNNQKENIVMACAGNKCDIDDDLKQISIQTVEELAKENNMIYYETSAKTNEGVQELFLEIINKIIICKR